MRRRVRTRSQQCWCMRSAIPLLASGEHRYFAYPGLHLKNTAGKLGPGLDIRCCGGYVVGPGAVHKTGHTYAWIDGYRPGQVALAKPPQWLIDQLTARTERPRIVPPASPKAYASAALASEERVLLSTPAGQRNTRLNLAAFRLARFAATEALARGDVEAVLLDVAARLGVPEREAEATINSGLRAGINRTT
jgi:putative DNA primase/helicase